MLSLVVMTLHHPFTLMSTGSGGVKVPVALD